MKPIFSILVAGVTLSTYLFTRLIDKAETDTRKKLFMIMNITLILLPLFFFKYFSNINDKIIELFTMYHLRWPLPEMKLILPIGISFYTFVAIGYTIDVYNEEIEVEKNIGFLALFISFFPLILSGPIERAGNMLPQFRIPHKFNYKLGVQGLKWILWGYFMKLVVADRIGLYVDAVYNNINHHNGTSLLFASIIYPFQVYADLGGYSLIAIGVSNILGIRVIQNFNRPFLATSMSDFWRRWHISLISWLTEYVYTPLSFTFRKYGLSGIIIALLITFLLSGIWHGPSMTFVVWGLMQGVLLSIEALFNNKRIIYEKKFNLKKKGLYVLFGISITYILFSASQIFARVPDLSEAFLVYQKIYSASGPLFLGNPLDLVFCLFGLSLIVLKDFTDEFFPTRFKFFENKYKVIRIISYSTIIIVILLIGVMDAGQFIYFQF